MSTYEKRIMLHVPNLQIGMRIDECLDLVADHLDNVKVENEKLRKKYETLRQALKFDYDYYEAKPHKCLSLLIDLKEALAETEEIK